MTGPDDRASTSHAAAPTPRPHDAFFRRRAATLFLVAGIVVVLALTSRWWLPGIPKLLGFMDDNSGVIDAFAGVAQIVTFVMLPVGAILAYLGFRSLQGASGVEGAQQAVGRCLRRPRRGGRRGR